MVTITSLENCLLHTDMYMSLITILPYVLFLMIEDVYYQYWKS